VWKSPVMKIPFDTIVYYLHRGSVCTLLTCSQAVTDSVTLDGLVLCFCKNVNLSYVNPSSGLRFL
jgi:hypothetical protein